MRENSMTGDSRFQDWWSQMGWYQGAPFSLDDMDLGEERLRTSPGEVIEAPLLPLRDMVMFPRMVTPLFVGRDFSIEAIEVANERGESLITVAQRDADVLEPGPEDLFTFGAEVEIGRMLRIPDGTISVLSQGLQRVQIVEYIHLEPYIRVRALPIYEAMEKTPLTEALMRAVLALFEKVVQLNRNLPEDAYVFAMNINDPGWLADLIAQAHDLASPFAPYFFLQQLQGLIRFQPRFRGEHVDLLPAQPAVAGRPVDVGEGIDGQLEGHPGPAGVLRRLDLVNGLGRGAGTDDEGILKGNVSHAYREIDGFAHRLPPQPKLTNPSLRVSFCPVNCHPNPLQVYYRYLTEEVIHAPILSTHGCFHGSSRTGLVIGLSGKKKRFSRIIQVPVPESERADNGRTGYSGDRSSQADLPLARGKCRCGRRSVARCGRHHPRRHPCRRGLPAAPQRRRRAGESGKIR